MYEFKLKLNFKSFGVLTSEDLDTSVQVNKKTYYVQHARLAVRGPKRDR